MSENHIQLDLNHDANQKAASHADFYNEFWADWPLTPTSQESNRVDFFNFALSKYTSRQDLEILDFGCGRGWLAPQLKRWGTVTGIDFSDRGIEFARRHYADAGEFIVADPAVARLGLPLLKLYDVLIISEVIEHVNNQEIFIDQIRDFLKPDGLLLLTTPNGYLWDLYRNESMSQKYIQPIENWLSPKDLHSLLRRNGFAIQLHLGSPAANLRPGIAPIRLLQHKKVLNIVRRSPLYHLYSRALRSVMLYQFLSAKKVTYEGNITSYSSSK